MYEQLADQDSKTSQKRKNMPISLTSLLPLTLVGKKLDKRSLENTHKHLLSNTTIGAAL
jgi:hypothetical protein